MPIEASSSRMHDGYFAVPVSGSCRSFAVLEKASGKLTMTRDRLPGATVAAAIDRAERGRAVAFDEMRSPDFVGLVPRRPIGHLRFATPVTPEMQAVDVGRQQFFLALVLLADQLLDQLRVQSSSAHSATR